MSKANEPAFPWMGSHSHQISGSGLTKREYFAAMAMQGMIAVGDEHKLLDTELAIKACRVADALLAELEKEPTR